MTMKRDPSLGVSVVDFRRARWLLGIWRSLGFPEAPLPGAEEVCRINWITMSPGVDWPERYSIERAGHQPHWILWVHDEGDTLHLDREAFPAAWMPVGTITVDEAARILLEAYWQVVADTGQERFEGPGSWILTWDQVERIADAVWGGGQRAS